MPSVLMQTYFLRINVPGKRNWFLLGDRRHSCFYDDTAPGDSFPYPLVGR